MLGRMTEKKKTYIVDDFIAKVRSHRAFQTGPWPQRIDDLEAILQACLSPTMNCNRDIR
jgi:hypothetical protein